MFGLEDNGHDLGPYTLGNKRTLRDYERYAGINFEKKSFQKYTKDNQPPPNPVIEDEEEWNASFMFSFYYLVNVTRQELPGDDYESILIAFDDEEGRGLHSKSITGEELKRFMDGGTIHYEEMFLTDKKPAKFVAWAVSKSTGWAERIEKPIT